MGRRVCFYVCQGRFQVHFRANALDHAGVFASSLSSDASFRPEQCARRSGTPYTICDHIRGLPAMWRSGVSVAVEAGKKQAAGSVGVVPGVRLRHPCHARQMSRMRHGASRIDQDGTRIHAPHKMRISPPHRLSHLVRGTTFSRRTNIVIVATQSRFITPATKSSTISSQQQPVQERP